MGEGVHVQELPGIGKRFDIDLGRADQRISVVARHNGARDLYAFATASDEPSAVIELNSDQARKLAAVLTGTFFQG